MNDEMPDSMFKKLGRKKEAEFRKWARDNYYIDSPIDPVWHPVVRDECKKINAEARARLQEHYVNLYRLVHDSNEGLWTKDIEAMSNEEDRKSVV